MRRPLIFWDVDTQVDFMRPDAPMYVPGAKEITGNLARLSIAASRYGIPVVAGADDHEISDIEISSQPDFQSTFPPHCIRDTAGAERIPETDMDWTLEVGHETLSPVQIRSGLNSAWPRVLIHKKNTDIFTNPNTELVYQLLQPVQVVVYGVALDFCVRRVVEGLLERDQKGILLLSDATRAIYPEQGGELLAEWAAAGVAFQTTDTFLQGLQVPDQVAVG